MTGEGSELSVRRKGRTESEDTHEITRENAKMTSEGGQLTSAAGDEVRERLTIAK